MIKAFATQSIQPPSAQPQPPVPQSQPQEVPGVKSVLASAVFVEAPSNPQTPDFDSASSISPSSLESVPLQSLPVSPSSPSERFIQDRERRLRASQHVADSPPSGVNKHLFSDMARPDAYHHQQTISSDEDVDTIL